MYLCVSVFNSVEVTWQRAAAGTRCSDDATAWRHRVELSAAAWAAKVIGFCDVIAYVIFIVVADTSESRWRHWVFADVTPAWWSLQPGIDSRWIRRPAASSSARCRIPDEYCGWSGVLTSQHRIMTATHVDVMDVKTPGQWRTMWVVW